MCNNDIQEPLVLFFAEIKESNTPDGQIFKTFFHEDVKEIMKWMLSELIKLKFTGTQAVVDLRSALAEADKSDEWLEGVYPTGSNTVRFSIRIFKTEFKLPKSI